MKKNVIYNEDVLSGISKIKDCSIDLIVTDPPYKTTSRGSSGGTGGLMKTHEFMSGNVFKYNNIKIDDWIKEMYRVLKDKGHIYIMTNNKNIKTYLNKIEDAGFKIFKTLIWVKNTSITNMWYMDTHEYIIFARKGGAKKINNCGTKSVLFYDNPKNKLHPTEKPVELICELIKNSSSSGDVIFDPFMGSGTTAISCLETKRNYIGFEIDEEYYNLSEKRIHEWENKQKTNSLDVFF